MNESHINRINELLGESIIYEAKKNTKIKLSLDDGSKKEIDFDGSLNDAKKKFSGKKVKTIRKSKSGDIIGEAVIINVEELNESEQSVVDKFPAMLTAIKKALKNPTVSKGPIEFTFPKSEYFSKDVVKSFQKYFTDKGYKVETGTDHPTTLYFDRSIASKLNESKELIPFGYFKITYSDGSSKKTEARAKTAEDFKKYLTQDGDTVTDEDDDGKETKKKIVKVEKLDEAENSGKKLIKITYEIWDEDSLEAGDTYDKGWEDEEGEEFESDEDGTAAEKAIKFLKKKDATNASDGSYQSGTWYQDDGDTDMKTGDKKYLAYHLDGSWTPEEKKEIYKGVTNKKINESTESEKVTFEKPLDIFKWIKDNNQYLYVKQNKDGKYEGSPTTKTKKGSILVDGITANWGIQIYNKVNDDSRKILDKATLERFLNIIISRTTKKVNESVEDKFEIVTLDSLLKKSLKQYFETMLWSSTDSDGNNLDKDYSVSDISDALKEKSKKDLIAFAEYCEKNCKKELEEYLSEEDYDSFGHDFWLSRNGHGAGFFDRGTGYKELQKAAKSFGEVDVYVTDDGEIDG
jgi:hypothetical protein